MTLEQVWAEYRAAIKTFLHSKVSDPAEVDDLLQEVMMRSYLKLDTLQETGKVRPWLFQVARNAVIDFYRARGRQPELREEELWYSESNLLDASQQLAQCVEPFINALPEPSSCLLRAIELEGCSQKTLAEQQGLSYSTLKSRVQKARLELRAMFEACCHMQLDTQGNIAAFEPRNDACKKC